MSARGGSRGWLFGAVVAFVALWPLAQRGLVLAFETDPWKLGGFAMYTSYQSTLVAVFRFEGRELRPVDEETLPPSARAQLERFRARRSALGRLVAPDAAAAALHAARPDLGSLAVVVQRLWLDRETARIASAKETFFYVEGHPFVPPAAP